MGFRRVLLVTPFSPGRFFGGIRPPVGMGYIEEYLASNGVTTSSCDMSAGLRFRHLHRKIAQFRPDLIGFTVMSYQFRHTYAVISRVKQSFPGILIVAGGPHVSAVEGSVLTQCPAIDLAVVGEGEEALLRVCRGEDHDAIGGLLYRGAGRIANGGPVHAIEDLNLLPFPRYPSYDLSIYPEIEISTSRGCPHPCIFCAVSTIMGKKIRYRSTSNVVDEIAYFYHTHGKRTFQVGDDNFLADRDRIIALCEEIVRRKFEGIILRCGQGIRGDLIERDVLEAMKRAGFRHLGIGVESGSDPVLASIRKGESVERIERGIALACELGFEVSLLFVLGTPGETVDDVEASIRLAEKYPVMKAFFFNLIPFPGTQLHRWVEERKAFLAPFDELINRRDELKLRSAPFFETAELNAADRRKAMRRTERVSKGIQVKAMERRLARWGSAGKIAAQAARFDFLERRAISIPIIRRILDRLIFRESGKERR
jgi:anaerobic magnesium-protoporphyrin IX monomethyl ester cyclase